MKVSNETVRKAREWAEEIMDPPYPHHLKDAVAAAAKVILSLPAPGPPTLAELINQGRNPRDFWGMQADRDGDERVIITRVWDSGAVNLLFPGGEIETCLSEEITPLEDQPRLVWPAEEPTADYAKGGAKKNLEELSQPGKLETLDDYRNAPVGTEVAAIDRTSRGWKKGSDRLWRIGTSNFGSDSEDMENIARDVTYWPGEK